IGLSVAQCECYLLDRRTSGFTDMVARNGNGVPAGELAAAPLENVGDDAHRGFWGVDISAAGGIFLQDVVLYGAADLREVGPLFPGKGGVQRQENKTGGIDGHRRADRFQPDPLEQQFHVVEGVDGNAGLPHLALRERVVAVVADLCWKVEGDAQAHDALAEEVVVARVAFFGGGKAGILSHRPQLAAVHVGLDAPGIGVLAWQRGSVGAVVRARGGGQICCRVDLFDGNAAVGCHYRIFFASKLSASETMFCSDAFGFWTSMSSNCRLRSPPVASAGRNEPTWLMISIF